MTVPLYEQMTLILHFGILFAVVIDYKGTLG